MEIRNILDNIITYCAIIGIGTAWLIMIVRRGKSKSIPALKIVLTTVFAATLICFCGIFPTKLDQSFLLEETHPSYWRWLGSANTTCVKPDEDSDEFFDPHIITTVSKYGFGGVTSEDLKFYMKTMKGYYPEAKWTTINFNDGTGIEIADNDLSKAVYGIVNADGKVDAEKKIDADKPLIAQIEGVTTIQYEFDDHNNPIYEAYFDAEGQKTVDPNGVSEYYREYDDRRHVIWEKRLGIDGQPAADANGMAEFRREYDEDYLIRESYYDGNGNPVCLTDRMFAATEAEYDAGHIVSEVYFDENNNKTAGVNGFARVIRVYDAAGNQTAEYYYDVKDVRVDSIYGYSGFRRNYDELGRIVSEEYVDVNDNPVNIDVGYSKCTYEYREDGALSLTFFYDSDGNKLEMGSGYFHEYLQSIKDSDAIIISIMDEGTVSLTETILEDLAQIGVKSDLHGKYRWSFYTILTDEEPVELLDSSYLEYHGDVCGMECTVVSAGLEAGNVSSIVLNGAEYSKSVRGMNIVTIKDGVISPVAFDTYDFRMMVTR